MLEVTAEAAISLEANNRLLATDSDRMGNYSLPFNLPLTPLNRAALGFPDVPAAINSLRRISDVELLDDGHLVARGDLVVRETGTVISAALIFGSAAVRKKLAGTRLADLELGGLRTLIRDDAESNSERSTALAARMLYICQHADEYNYLFAPVRCCEFLANWYEPTWTTTDTLSSSGAVQHGFVWNSQWSVPGQVLPWPRFAGTLRMMPLPRLSYVITAAFAELGIPLDSDFFDAETKNLVFLPTSPLDQVLDSDPLATGTQVNGWGRTFRIGELLPDMSVLDLVDALCGTFALLFDVDNSGRAQLLRTARIIQHPGAVDLTRFVAATSTRTFSTSKAQELAQSPEPESVADLANQIVLGPVGTFYNLAALNGVEEGKFRLVLDERRYYQSALDDRGDNGRFYVWNAQGLYLPTFTVGVPAEGESVNQLTVPLGFSRDVRMPLLDMMVDVVAFDHVASLSGPQVIDGRSLVAGDLVLLVAQNAYSFNGVYQVAAGAWTRPAGAATWSDLIGLTVMARYGRGASYGLRFTVTGKPGGIINSDPVVVTRTPPPPSIPTKANDVVEYAEGKGYSPELGTGDRQKVLRLAFWRGWQHYKLPDGSASADTFPCVSIHNRDQFGNRHGQYSLRIDGEDGLGQVWWQPLMQVRSSEEVYKVPLYIDASRLRWLFGLFSKKVAVQGREYLVQRISVTLPIKAPATIELIPAP